MILAAVAPRQGQPALEGLEVVQDRLRLDRATLVPASDDRIPGAKIAFDRERYLGRPAQTGVEPGPKPLQQGELCPITEGIARGIAAQGEIQTHDRAPRTEVRDRDAVEFATLEPQKLLVRSSRCGSRITQAQSCAGSSKPVVVAQSPHRLAGASPAAVTRSFSGSHGWEHRSPPVSVAYAAVGPRGGPTRERHSRQGARGRPQPLDGPGGGPSEGGRGFGRLTTARSWPSFAPWSGWRTRRGSRAWRGSRTSRGSRAASCGTIVRTDRAA